MSNKIHNFQKNNWIEVLAFCVFSLFVGRAYQYIFWDAPYRVILWSENLVEPIVMFFYNSWDDYAKDLRLTNLVQKLIKIHGILFAVVAIAIAYKSNSIKKNWFGVFYLYATAHIFLLSILNSMEHYGKFFSFFEHTTQFSIPILLYYAVKKENQKEKEDYVLKWGKRIVAITFLSHGIYALGLHPVPGRFVDMTILTLNCSETTARLFLEIAGIMDVVVFVGVFLPRINKYIFIYAAFWGFSTSLARIWGYFELGNVLDIFHSKLYLVVYRLPHGLLPIVCYLILSKKEKSIE